MGALAVLVLVMTVTALWWRGRGGDDGPGAGAPEAPRATAVAVAPSPVPIQPTAGQPAPTAPTPTAEATPVPAASATPAEVTYTVESGDSLWTISRRLGVDLAALSEANPGADRRLDVGQQLVVPVTAPPPGPETAPGEATVPTALPAGPSPTAGPTVPPEVYTVLAGDSLGSVASAHGLAVADLVAMNEGELAGPEADLVPGQTLRVRQAVPAGPAGPADLAAAAAFVAPWPLAPANGASVREDAPLLRWVSAGILPEDVYYVVSLWEVDATGQPAAEDLRWVASNATALAVPARYRPAPGSTRTLRWAVTVRRVAGDGPGAGPGEILSPVPEPRQFTWSP